MSLESDPDSTRAARAFHDVVAAITAAAFAEDLFGELGGKGATAGDNLGALAALFRRIARTVHPDLQPPSRTKQAHAAFVKATSLRETAERAIRAGRYGERLPAPMAPQTITARKRKYRVEALAYRGDLCDLYPCSWETPSGEARGLFKVVSCAGDGDLVENEANVLRRLFPTNRPEEKFLRYLPRFVDSFVLEDEDARGTERRVVVVPHFDEHVSLSDVMVAYPNGLDFRDAVWMLKRLLVVLGWVHRRGLVHGAVLPSHLLIHPKGHGARLVDWCYAVPIGQRVRALSSAQRDLYAPEIPAKKPATPSTDIYMAAQCFRVLVGETRVPAALRRFFESCLMTAPSRRPDDAWKLHDELDELLRRLVGPPSYRRLEMPGRD